MKCYGKAKGKTQLQIQMLNQAICNEGMYIIGAITSCLVQGRFSQSSVIQRAVQIHFWTLGLVIYHILLTRPTDKTDRMSANQKKKLENTYICGSHVGIYIVNI